MLAMASGFVFLALVLVRSPEVSSSAIAELKDSKIATMDVARSTKRVAERSGKCSETGETLSVTHHVVPGGANEVLLPIDAALQEDGWEYSKVPVNGPVFAMYRKEVSGEAVQATLSMVKGQEMFLLELEFLSTCE
jgi:hypothetical protein